MNISSCRGECSRLLTLLTLLILLRFKQKGHRNLCGRSRSYQGIWRKVKLRRSVDSIRHPKSKRMASSREINWKCRREKGGDCLFQEVKWEPGTTRNHKTFHAQAAERPPKKIKVGRGRLLNRSIRTRDLKNKLKRLKAKARKGEVEGRKCERGKAKMVRDGRFNFPEML